MNLKWGLLRLAEFKVKNIFEKNRVLSNYLKILKLFFYPVAMSSSNLSLVHFLCCGFNVYLHVAC